jgi:uncharacterized protein (TIGR03546 family)
MPLVPLTRFNNSIVMGSGITTLFLAPIGFFVFRALILRYRRDILAKFQNTKAWKLVKATSLYQWYCKFDDLYG